MGYDFSKKFKKIQKNSKKLKKIQQKFNKTQKSPRAAASVDDA
jgi:hypothetical protein